MVRRRRRNRGTWFPNISTAPPGEGADTVSGRVFDLDIVSTSNHLTVTGVVPLTFDYPQEPNEADSSIETLSELIGSEYIFKRLVGKFFAVFDGAQGSAPAVLLGAGLFVARAQDSSSLLGANVPIGFATSSLVDDQYGVLNANTIREPWMWRRTWLLGNPTALTVYASVPDNTMAFGSVMDGPHIDCRVKRRVRQDERLWFAASALRYPFTSEDDTQNATIACYLDYRIFGELRKARNTSSF